MRKIITFIFIAISLIANAQSPCTPPVITITGAAWRCRGVRDTLTVSGPNGTTYVWSSGITNTTYLTGPIYSDSTISVIGTNGGCSDTAYFMITARIAPVITFPRPPLACIGLSVELVPNVTGTGPFTYSWSPGGQTTDSISVPSPPDSTNTTYTVTVSNGCSSTRTVTISSEFPVLNACCDFIISNGHDTILVASGNCVSYAWQPSASVICLNSICDSVRVSPIITTTYTVTGTDAAGCQVEGHLTVIVEPAGIPTINGTDFVNIYPNPSSTTFTVTLQHQALLNVCDVTGRLLFSKMENAGNVIFGKELNPGMYFLFIDGKPGVKIVKL